jgi:hypothetical protein
VKYNKHKGSDNYYREKLMLYVPYRFDENIFKEKYSTWKNAYLTFKEIIKCNEQKFTNKIIESWSDFDNIIDEIENEDN